MTGVLATSAVPLSYAYSSTGAGKMSLPVAASELLYSNFQHVSGVAASPGQAVASIDRLKILDTLIERLSSMKSQPLEAAQKPEGMSSERIDALIQQYGSELRTAAVAPAAPYSISAPVESGMLFNFAA